VCGKYLPHGTRVSTNGAVYAVGRAKAYWGADAKLFRPERWLEADAVTKQRMSDMVDLMWGGGAFVCPGKAIGVMTAGKAVAEAGLFLDVPPRRNKIVNTINTGCPPLRHFSGEPR
jgi:hypothetical protein